MRNTIKSNRTRVLISAKMIKRPIFCINQEKLNPNSDEIKIFFEDEKGVKIEPILIVIVIP